MSSSASGGTTLSYDPLGRLWKIWSQQTGTTSFVYEGDHVSAEYDWAGNMLRRYFWGPGADEPIIQDEGGALNCTGTRFLHANHQGSIIATSNCNGNLTAINRYDEYGIPQGNWGRFQYTGQAWLPELGMYYYKARIYSPTLGRFLQIDPIGYEDQVNLYAYVGNDPVNYIDPSGESKFKRLVFDVVFPIVVYLTTGKPKKAPPAVQPRPPVERQVPRAQPDKKRPDQSGPPPKKRDNVDGNEPSPGLPKEARGSVPGATAPSETVSPSGGLPPPAVSQSQDSLVPVEPPAIPEPVPPIPEPKRPF